jgi:hypothetical protein
MLTERQTLLRNVLRLNLSSVPKQYEEAEELQVWYVGMRLRM